MIPRRSIAQLCFGLCLLVSRVGLAADLVPLADGNEWVLKAFLNPDPIAVSISGVRSYGPSTMAYLKIDHQKLGRSISLVSIKSDGVYLEGYVEDGVTHLFAQSWPYFVIRPQGSAWTNPYGKVELTHDRLTTTSATGTTYENCLRYHVTLNGGGEFIWVLKPGTGFIRFGDGAGAFTLRSYKLNSQLTAGGPGGESQCPLVGLSSIPRGPEVTHAMRETALAEARAAGVTMLKVEASWEELEPAPGVYDLNRLMEELELARTFNLPVVLTIKTVDTTIRSIPADLNGEALGSEVVLARFAALLNKVGSILPPQVKWINLGYELDFYLLIHPQDIPGFVTLFSYGRQRMKEQGDYSVGLVFQYDNSRISDVIFQALTPLCDHVSVNYYAHTEGFKMRDPDVPLVDIPFMVQAVKGGTPILITELGYASSEVIGGTPAAQARFLQRAFEAVAANSDRIKAVNVWAIRDLPQSYVQNLVSRFQLDDPEFIAFLGSLGLQDEEGRPKPSWDVFTEQTFRFSRAGTCSASR